MRIVLQRVKNASVSVEGRIIGSIDKGLLLFIGITHSDTTAEADFLCNKIVDLRIFEDSNNKMNVSLKDINGSVLVVSQFTLYGDCSKGRRPSFIDAAAPDKAIALYDYFVEKMKSQVQNVATGEFGAMMNVALVNDGPVTLVLEK
jgi:D-tyrosyl-tRNA(Tyr) deacylase